MWSKNEPFGSVLLDVREPRRRFRLPAARDLDRRDGMRAAEALPERRIELHALQPEHARSTSRTPRSTELGEIPSLADPARAAGPNPVWGATRTRNMNVE
jgi:hypothetical protein